MYSEKALRSILKKVRSRQISEQKAFNRLKNLPYEILDFARIDHHRHFRKGFPEAIYSPGKTVSQMAKIVRSIGKSGQPVLLTRLDPAVYAKLKKHCPKLVYHPQGRIAYQGKKKMEKRTPIAVVTAGTSDIPVAEEAAITLEVMGRPVKRVYDCGVAAIHRLFDQLPEIEASSAVICVAGMGGALASVLAGMVAKPVIAVPASIGYGANFKGLSSLLAMINSCAQGIAVVNIDNGFGAACFASMIP